MTLVATISGALVAAGVVAAMWAFQPAPEPRPRIRRPRFSADSRTMIVLGVGGGVVIALVTGWLVAVVILPAVLVLVRRVVTRRARPRTARLDALAEFARGIAGVLEAGRGIEQAILQAALSAPQAIEPEVAKLAARIRANWEIERALCAFADDFDDATADLFVATLLLASERRGPGLAAVMQDIAASVDQEVRARREVETEQQKPRTAAGMITLITTTLLLGLVVTGDYIAPYSTPFGQLLLTTYLAAYLAVLGWMAHMTKEQPIPRFLGTTTQPRGQ
ncbi:type II secretion system F family protein [Tessaracoccus sp. OS52]|uniref:type II secretion system F family protein n=1 Tax=Tessaracoccus sp. OS52 TaxID=2886691 RepID=UPI001D12A536|nr:type II secretion system F family protein [Tessaracoccus sp. OS52]MCC2592476.1 type II secretion system F family protein [Tessaracoccus sp. OS52]